MAVRSILSIDVRDGQFKDFLKSYERYQAALKKAPAAWALVNKNIDGSKASFDKLVAQMAAANVQEQLRAKAQERADRLTRSSAERWSAMARDTREFARNIAGATTQLLKWGSLTGLIGGLLGAGGLFGIDRLAVGAASSRRGALGIGATIGGQEAFKTNFGRLVDTDSFLSAVAGAKFDVTKRVGLLGAGLTQGQIAGRTEDTAVALLDQLKRIADTTNPALFAQVLQSRRLDQFAGATDLERLRNTSPEEYQRLRSQYGQRRGQFDLPPDVAERWQDFVTQLGNAGKSIETTLVKGLVPLAPGLTKLSESVEKVISVFLEKGGPLEKWITQAGNALEKFAGYVGTDDFQQKVRAFVEGIGAIGAAIGRLGSWFGGGEAIGGKGVRDRAAWSRRHAEGVKTAGELRRERAEGKATALGQLGRIFGFGSMSDEDLLKIVRRSEASGDQAVSPKGAIGRYQITPDTARTYGADPSRLTDPVYNEQVARKILADLIKRYHGNTKEILAAYNAGPGAANRFRAAGDNPAVLPAETQRYITRAGAMSGYASTTVTIENNTGGNAIVSTNGLKN